VGFCTHRNIRVSSSERLDHVLGGRRLVAHLVKSCHKCNPPISESTLKKEIRK